MINQKNLVKDFCPIRPNVVWVIDYTKIKYPKGQMYLMSVMDLFTKEIIGWEYSLTLDREFFLDTIKHALLCNYQKAPLYFHIDCQTEELEGLVDFLTDLKTIVSVNDSKSFYQTNFYHELTDNLNQKRIKNIEDLVGSLYQMIRSYNNINLSDNFSLSPLEFKVNYYHRTLRITKQDLTI